MPNEELKPCPVPWCVSNSCENYPPVMDRIAPMKYRVKCGWCGTGPRIDFITEAEAIAGWNTRPNSPVIPEGPREWRVVWGENDANQFWGDSALIGTEENADSFIAARSNLTNIRKQSRTKEVKAGPWQDAEEKV